MQKSAGILLFRSRPKLQVLLVHPGGPFWKNKDEAAWSIPKGEADDGENLRDAAIREFKEETGVKLSGDFIELKPIKQISGKWVHAWALEGDLDVSTIKSNLFTMEWPPRSGKMQEFPEIDKAAWFTVEEARIKMNGSQYALIEDLVKKLLAIH
ncbi:MAG: NUDIX domain-containing protein [Chitinophagaceae bacterium]|nr:MAG: NUDIX domain-containing protein [Chitinophagaceae bacterium]